MNIDEQQQQDLQQNFNKAVRKTALTKAKAVRDQLAAKQRSEREARKAQIDGMLVALGRAVNKFAISQQYDLRNEIDQLNLQFYNLLPTDIELLDELIQEGEGQ